MTTVGGGVDPVKKRPSRFVILICSRFDREQIQRIVIELPDLLANRTPEVKPER